MALGLVGSAWPFVGRGELLDRLLQHLDEGAVSGVTLFGGAGVGKTRLAGEVTAAASRRGFEVARLVGTALTQSIPLATVAPIIPPDLLETATDPLSVAAVLRRRQLEAGRLGERLVVHADDLNLFDTASLVVLSQLGAAGTAFVVGTIRAETEVAEPVSAMWARGDWERIDVPPLGAESFETMLHLALGGPVAGDVAHQLWERTAGNPLMARELVAGAVAEGSIRAMHGVWTLTGDIGLPQRLADLVATRLRSLPASARAALARIAVAQPVSPSELERDVTIDDLVELERREHISVVDDGRRQVVTIAHPMLAEAVLAGLTRTEVRRLRLEALDRIAVHGARRRDDALRIASWNLDVGRPVDPATLRRAIDVARQAGDLTTAERLVHVNWEQSRSVQALLVLADLRLDQGRFGEVEELLAGIDLDAVDVELRADVVVARTLGRVMGGTDGASALAELAERMPLLDGRGAALVHTVRVLVRALDDDVTALAEDDGAPAPTTTADAIARVHLLTQLGRTADAVAFAEAATTDGGAAGEPGAMARIAVLRPFVLGARLAAGDVRGVCAIGEILDQGDWILTPSSRPPTTAVIARAWLERGDAVLAARWFREALASSGFRQIAQTERRAAVGLAHSLAVLGELGEAEVMLAHAECRAGGLRSNLHELALAQAAVAVAAGDPESARATLRSAVTVASSRGLLMPEAALLHALFRLDATRSIALRLGEIAERTDSRRAALWAVHARAVVDRDAVGLDRVARELEQLTLFADARAALADLTDVAGRLGDRRAATAAQARADALARADAAGGSAAPPVVALSRREREVADLAAGRVPSKEIARRLSLSVRTVNNHLQNVYTKLGINSREQLTQHLGGRPR